ncbi:type II toxin-antitoxin system YafO family toxin [Morganella morganii]|uniref:type II toxin-antitoxin system YafO family toxin n=1 Tax=Morganella morganii TaxID=582 RepID=UPI00339CBCA8
MDEIEVTINEQARAQFFGGLFQKHQDLESCLINDFKKYKSDGVVPSYFGRDVAYVQPYSALKACLMHIHLKIPPDKFPSDRVQYYRTHKTDDSENDICLVYTQGLIEDHRYSIIAILHPDAHVKARDYKVMDALAQLAQDFRDNN